MIFSFTFEIGLLVLGSFYVLNLWFDSIIDLIRIGHEIDEKDKSKDEELQQMTKHLYS